MKKILMSSAMTLVLVLVSTLQQPVRAAETLSLQAVLQQVAANYSDIRIAAMQVDRAQQDVRVVQAQIGWTLNGNASTSAQPALGGAPSPQSSASVGVSRQTASGSNISITGGYNYDGTDLSPALPLYPTTTLSLNLNYRIPLGQGRGNAQYQQSLTSAEAGANIAEANLYLLRDNIARNIMDLYYGSAQTWYSLANARSSLKRAQQLLEVERKNVRLGLSEHRDLLNREAQLHAAESDLNNLRQLWVQQRTSLNRLMGRPWDQEFVPLLPGNPVLPAHGNPVQLADEVTNYDPQLRIRQNELLIAEAKLQTALDTQRSRVDLVMGAGVNQRSSNGSTSNDTTYNLGFEYQRPVNPDGYDAQLYQAQVDRDIAKQRLKATKDQVQYDVSSLIQRIGYLRQMVVAQKARLDAQEKRYADIQQRFKEGRATTAELLMGQAELEGTRFALQQQQIEYAKQIATLNMMRGQLWMH